MTATNLLMINIGITNTKFLKLGVKQLVNSIEAFKTTLNRVLILT